MRVPTIEQPSVLPGNPYGSTRPNIQQPDLRLAQAIGNVGNEVAQVGQSIGGVMAEDARIQERANAKALKDAEDAQKRAKAALQAEALVELQRKADDEAAGLFSREGFDAMRESGPTKDKLDKHLKEIGERFVDPLDRLEFENLGNAALLSRRKAIEEYTTKQNLAGTKATLEGMRAEAVRGASSVDLTPEEMKASVAAVDATYDRILPPEAAAAAKTELRADMSEAMIQRRIQAGDVEGAKTILAGDESILGPKRTAALKGKVESAQKDLTAKSVAVEVNDIAERVRDEHRIVTGKALSDAMPKLAEDDPRREAFEAALSKQQAIEDKRLKELLEVEKNNASNAINDDVAIPAETEAVLRKYDREALEALKAKAEARRQAAAAHRRGNRQELNDALRRQAEINGEAEEKFAALLKRDPNANHRDFILQFTREVSAREGRPVTVTPRFEAKLENDAETARKSADTAEGRSEAKFSSDVESAIDGMTVLKKGGKPDEALTRNWGGYAALRYQAAVRQNGGKELSPEQADKLSAAIIHEAVAESGGKGKVTRKPALAPVYEAQKPEEKVIGGRVFRKVDGKWVAK